MSSELFYWILLFASNKNAIHYWKTSTKLIIIIICYRSDDSLLYEWSEWNGAPIHECSAYGMSGIHRILMNSWSVWFSTKNKNLNNRLTASIGYNLKESLVVTQVYSFVSLLMIERSSCWSNSTRIVFFCGH